MAACCDKEWDTNGRTRPWWQVMWIIIVEIVVIHVGFCVIVDRHCFSYWWRILLRLIVNN